jgi:hypothetical protein
MMIRAAVALAFALVASQALALSPLRVAALLSAPPKVERNVASPMSAPNVAVTPTSPRFRLVSTLRRHVHRPVSRIKLIFQCVNVTGVPASCPASYTINSLQVWQGSKNAVASWNNGNRTRIVPQGATEDATDWIPISLSPGAFFININVTVSSSGYVAGKFYSTSALEGGTPEVSWACDPTVCTGDTNTGAALTIPSGGVAALPIAPSLIVAKVKRGTISIAGGVTSLSDGTGDLTTSNGSIGGGMLRRGAWQGGWPIATWSTNGQNYNNMQNSVGTSVRTVFNRYASVLWLDGPTNDVFAGTAASSIRTNILINYWQHAHNTRTKVVQGNIIQRVATGHAAFYTATSGQTTTGVTGFGVGGAADTYNSGLADDYANGAVDAVADVRPVLSDATGRLWAAAPFSTTLTASALSNAVQFQTAATFPLIGCPIFDPTNAAGQRAGSLRHVYTQSGTPPSVLNTLFSLIGVAQNNGNTVVRTHSQDGTHPCGVSYDALGAVYKDATLGLIGVR